MAVSFWIILDQICPNLIKLYQIGFLTNQKMLLLVLIFWIRSVKLFGQKQVFGSNGFSAETAFRPKIHTFVKFEVAFWPEMVFWHEMAFFK